MENQEQITPRLFNTRFFADEIVGSNTARACVVVGPERVDSENLVVSFSKTVVHGIYMLCYLSRQGTGSVTSAATLAKEVTGISGRGVGMDVVRRNIEQLRGKVEITSQLGKGSTFSIRLPLTLAIIDGMILRVGSERFIIQTITVEQALRPRPEQITTVQHKGAVLNVRGRLIPLVQLGSLFGLSEPVNPCGAIVVIAQYAGGEVGLVVEELLDQQQVVIKSLGERFTALRGVSGAAILGDGRVGLILEMSGLTAAHNASRISYQRSDLPVRVTSNVHEPIPANDNEVNNELTDDVKHLVPT